METGRLMPAAEKRDPERELREAIGSFRHDPERFVRFAFPWREEGTELAAEEGPREWQLQQLRFISEALKAGASAEGAIRIAVASGHGIGKSTLVAWIILWALVSHPQTKVTITANTGDQLRTKTWPEVSKWFNLMICRHWFRLEATSISARQGAYAKTWRCDAATWSENNTVAFQGLHNKGKRLVLIFDEASEIVDKIWEVAEGAMTDEDTEIIWAVFGNPTVTTGRFRECFAGGRFSHRWKANQIDSREVPGTNKREIAKWIEDYGDDSDFVRVRVKGQFPRGGSMQFIDSELVEQAMKRAVTTNLREALILGVDVARFGAAQSVIYFRRGREGRYLPPLKFRGLDTMQLAARVADVAKREGAQAIFVDEGGIGAGVVDRLRQMRVPGVIGVNFGGKADRLILEEGQPATANKRAEMWASMRTWLKTGAIPKDPELQADLTGVEYGFNIHNEIQLEAKEHMVKRGLSSPDIGDALALTFAYPVMDLPDQHDGMRYDGGSVGSGDRVTSDYDPMAELE